ncbi:MAG: aminopeptidase [Spirochaetales bacterium]|nr:aminopeptidase [Spirochaetales bacterium]
MKTDFSARHDDLRTDSRRFGGYRFSEALARYAACILDVGAALEKGQYLLVSALTVHRDLALALAEAAYRRGASYVNVLYQDELLSRTQLELGGESSVTFLPRSVTAAYEEVIERRGAFVSLSGREDLEAFRAIDPERQSRSLLYRLERLDFFYEHIYTNRIVWCVAAGAAPGAAAAAFPDLPAGEALAALWDRIFEVCRIYESDPASAWRGRTALLERLKGRLDGLRLRELRFQSPTCDFSLRLSERARWRGGFSRTPEGRVFLANIPTEEVFTVPDWRSLDGRFTATRPLVYKNICVPELTLAFREGRLIAVEGGAGVKELEGVLRSDPTHGRAGEIALVSADSAVARTGLAFHDILYDENAACHLALGSGYADCLEGVGDMSPEDRENAGFNNASVHIDIMFGSQELRVTGRDADGRELDIMREGRFVDE